MKPIDSCISHFVEALNTAGIYTGGSCCGHGKGDGCISLHDGTVLIIERHDPDDMPCASESLVGLPKVEAPTKETCNVK